MKTKNLTARGIRAALALAAATSGLPAQELRELPETLGVEESEVVFNSSAFQNGIRTDKNLGALAKEESHLGEDATSFQFAGKSEESKFFLVGTMYSESLAFVNGGQFDLAANRLKSIEMECLTMRAPRSIHNYVSRVRNMTEGKQYSKEVLGEFLALFQPIYDDYAKGKSVEKLILFRAGTWLVDMSLGAAANNTVSLKQEARLDYFLREMKRLDAPPGVLTALDEIAAIIRKTELTERDAAKVLKLAKEIQTVLG